MASDAVRLLAIVAVLAVIVLLWAIVEGLSLEWSDWAFRRDKGGQYSKAKRLSQAFWIVLVVCVAARIAYTLVFLW